jgi:nucleotide-binding universal stress UspA family protein
MKKILIAMDYNPTAQKVAETGYLLGKTLGAKIILLHVITDPILYTSMYSSPIMGFDSYMDVNPLRLDTVEGLKLGAKHFLDKSRQHLGDETIQTIIKEGDFAESILETANKMHVDIIVLGSHSSRWLEQVLIGSVTEKVLRHTSIPLFIVPTKKQD